MKASGSTAALEGHPTGLSPFRYNVAKFEARNPKQIQNPNDQNSLVAGKLALGRFGTLEFRASVIL
jgi:hypothetical protein